MTIVSRSAGNGSVRGQQAAAAAVLVKFLAYDLLPVTWTVYDHGGPRLVGQMRGDQRGDEQLASALAMWSELFDGRFSRMPINEQFVCWNVDGTYEGVSVRVWAWVSVEFDAAHELPTVAAAEVSLEDQAEDAYVETMLTAAKRLEQTVDIVRAQIDHPGSLLHATDAELAELAEASEQAFAARAAR